MVAINGECIKNLRSLCGSQAGGRNFSASSIGRRVLHLKSQHSPKHLSSESQVIGSKENIYGVQLVNKLAKQYLAVHGRDKLRFILSDQYKMSEFSALLHVIHAQQSKLEMPYSFMALLTYSLSQISQQGQRSPACIVNFCSFKSLQKIHTFCDCHLSHQKFISS